MSSIDDKINFILSAFLNEDVNIKKAKFWNMGTDAFGIFKRLYKNIESISVNEISNIEVVSTNLQNEKGNETFEMLINGKNITPIISGKPASKNAVSQYLRILSIFGILFYDSKKIIGKWQVTSSFKNTIQKNISDEEWEVSCELIVLGTQSLNRSTKNLSYSFFLYLLKYYKFDWSQLKSVNKIIHFQKKIDNNDSMSITDFINEKNWDEAYSKTYKQIVENVAKQTSLEKLIEFIFKGIKNRDNFYISNFLNLSDNKKTNSKWDLSSERAKFKKAITEDRKSLGVLSGEINELYSDLEIYEESNVQNNIVARVNDLEAAHIFDMWRIDEELNKDRNNEIITLIKSYASDPKNGLLMCVKYHTFFDKKYFNFNINGEMIYSKEYEKYLFDDLKLHKVRIKPKVMDEKMIYFLSQRTY